MRLLICLYFLATTFSELDKNEVVEAADFGKNQQEKLHRPEHPTFRRIEKERYTGFY
jgi:hypothetical protein